MLLGAILNCKALDAQYHISGGHNDPLPVEAFAKFFLTEPVETGQDQNIYVELIGVVEPGSGDDAARDIVQLYR